MNGFLLGKNSDLKLIEQRLHDDSYSFEHQKNGCNTGQNSKNQNWNVHGMFLIVERAKNHNWPNADKW